jgi:homeobox protein cut-like
MEEIIISNEIKEAYEFWKEFNLDLKRESLDKTVIEIKDLKTASINGRKKLNEITKSFRNKSSEEQISDLPDLLKSYQDEIDQLSRRSKFCESSFLSLYKSIYDAPDPAPIIQSLLQSLSSTSTYQLDIKKLKSEISQYEKEFQQLKNQDITIRRLEDQLNEYKLKIEDKVTEEVNKRVTDLEEQMEEKVANVREIQKAAEKRLALAVESMKQAQASAEQAQNQLYDVSSQAESRLSALTVENNMLAESSNRLSTRVSELENEIEFLKSAQSKTLNTASISSSIEGGQSPSQKDDVQTLNLIIQELRQELIRCEDLMRSERINFEQRDRESTQLLAKERDQLSRLRQELAERPLKEDYILAKRQLRLLQKVTFHLSDDDPEVFN